MQATDSVQAFYEAELQPQMKQLDSQRSMLLFKIIGVLITCAVALSGAGYFIHTIVNDARLLLVFTPIFALLVMGVFMVYDNLVTGSNYYRNYKRRVIRSLLGLIDSTLHFDNLNSIRKKDFDNSLLFDKKPVSYNGDDHIIGEVNGIPIEFSELEVKFKRKQDRKLARSKTQFKGLFFKATCPRPFPADLVVEPLGFPVPDGHTLIDMPADAFSQQFQVRVPKPEYKQEALGMLRESVKQRLLEVSGKTNSKLAFSIVYDRLNVAIHEKEDLFEPPIWSSADNLAHMQEHYSDLFFPVSIIESLAITRGYPEQVTA